MVLPVKQLLIGREEVEQGVGAGGADVEGGAIARGWGENNELKRVWKIHVQVPRALALAQVSVPDAKALQYFTAASKSVTIFHCGKQKRYNISLRQARCHPHVRQTDGRLEIPRVLRDYFFKQRGGLVVKLEAARVRG
jgi:hypothetical protein